MVKLLKDLPVGSLVKDEGSKYYGKPIVWKVLDHDHSGYPSNSTTLLSEQIICLKAMDAKESKNSNRDRKNYGNNRYTHSNLRQWLNSSASSWYSAQHAADASPTSSDVSYNSYDTEKGFMANLTSELRSAILPTNLKVTKNPMDGKGLESFTDKIFLLSCTEVGVSNDTSYDEGTKFDYFKSKSDRGATTTKECVANSDYTDSWLKANSSWHWWTRTPHSSYTYPAEVFYIYSSGEHNTMEAYIGHRGVRPALNLPSSTQVLEQPDSDGVYSIMWNQPPEKPGKITLPEVIMSGQENTIRWSKATDPEGDKVGYKLERKVNGGSWAQVYQGENLNYKDSILRTHNTVQYRVKAYDVHGNESDWTFSETVTVVHNRPPKISGEDKDLGVQDKGFEVPYTVSDEDGDKVTVVVRLNDKELSRSVVELDKEYKVDFTGENFLTIPDGKHQLIIQATDEQKATTTRRYTFSRVINETTATLKEPLESAENISQAIMSIAGQVDELSFRIEATNNGFDENPVWIDVTNQVLTGRKIFFDNQTATSGKFGYNFKLTLIKTDQPAYIRSVGGNFI